MKKIYLILPVILLTASIFLPASALAYTGIYGSQNTLYQLSKGQAGSIYDFTQQPSTSFGLYNASGNTGNWNQFILNNISPKINDQIDVVVSTSYGICANKTEAQCEALPSYVTTEHYTYLGSLAASGSNLKANSAVVVSLWVIVVLVIGLLIAFYIIRKITKKQVK